MNLRIGSKGKSVTDLQNMLNNKVVPSPRLKADGDFGNKTHRAVVSFQNANWLTPDGVVGKCTWNALTGNEKYNVLHRVNLVSQPTNDTCWAASTAMLLGLPTAIKLPPALAHLAPPGTGLLNDSAMQNPTHMQEFCNYYRLTLNYPQSYTADGLYDLIKRKPVMANILWDTSNYVSGAGSSGHMIVIAGIRGNGEEDGTTLRIYDPWPPTTGKVSSEIYSKLVKTTPTFTYHLYQKK